MKAIDLAGKRFGRWTVMGRFYSADKRNAKWNCKCDCGTVRGVVGNRLRNGESTSCGCKKAENASVRMTIHGASIGGETTAEYRVWSKMKSRCSNPHNNRYHRYGGRGIKVCDRWLHSFENFLADMGKCPDGHSIDRKNNDLDYTPENCKWSTATEQARNRSTARPITFNGRTQLISDWAAEMNVNKALLTKRFKRGWSVEKTLTTPSLAHPGQLLAA